MENYNVECYENDLMCMANLKHSNLSGVAPWQLVLYLFANRKALSGGVKFYPIEQFLADYVGFFETTTGFQEWYIESVIFSGVTTDAMKKIAPFLDYNAIACDSLNKYWLFETPTHDGYWVVRKCEGCKA